jgi:type II secretory ATPase GspE/PulE/Tfp pilus assembly ATPase PilB-like protein
MRGGAKKSYGLVLVVGPTGCGKTTTLHSVIRDINTAGRKIWTAEDPIEITQSGLRQVQVNPASAGPLRPPCAPFCAPTPTSS